MQSSTMAKNISPPSTPSSPIARLPETATSRLLRRSRGYSKMTSSVREAFETKILNNLNRDCAKRLRGIFLKVPQPNPTGHAAFVQFEWTQEQATAYLETGILPHTLYTIDPESIMIPLWIFAADGSIGPRFLPELAISRLPDFQNQPALCIIDMGCNVKKEQEV